MEKENFYSALTLANDLFGLEISSDQFETWGMVGWNKIGNKTYKLKQVEMHPEPDKDGGWSICKPCDLNAIEAITLPYEDALETSSKINFPLTYTRPIENWIEGNKRMPNQLYISGKLVKYSELGNKIMFTEPFSTVHILYKTYLFDENDLPELNEKEKYAIALYVAYCYYRKLAFKTKDSATMQEALLLKADWLKACDNARTPIDISQNTANEILDTLTTYDRHMYGRTSKPIK